MDFLINLIAYVLLWIAIGYKRDSKTYIKPFSRDWIIVAIMVVSAGLILTR